MKINNIASMAPNAYDKQVAYQKPHDTSVQRTFKAKTTYLRFGCSIEQRLSTMRSSRLSNDGSNSMAYS